MMDSLFAQLNVRFFKHPFIPTYAPSPMLQLSRCLSGLLLRLLPVNKPKALKLDDAAPPNHDLPHGRLPPPCQVLLGVGDDNVEEGVIAAEDSGDGAGTVELQAQDLVHVAPEVGALV